MKGKKLFTIIEAAEYCGVHPCTVYRWIDKGEIPYFQTVAHSKIRVRRADLDKMLPEKRKPQNKTEFVPDGSGEH
jgi:excisionase family DNA binding protein